MLNSDKTVLRKGEWILRTTAEELGSEHYIPGRGHAHKEARECGLLWLRSISSATGDAFAVAVELHHTAAERKMDGYLGGLDEGIGPGAGDDLAAAGRHLVRV